jgi:hypothetical protein
LRIGTGCVFGLGSIGDQKCMSSGCYAQVAQSVEHVLGKDEVGGSIPLLGFAAIGTNIFSC